MMEGAVNPFASTVFSADEYKGSGDGEDPEVRSRHLEIIEKLLANFDLEETEARYRSLNACEIAIDQRNFSIDCELDATRGRERLVKLMGSNLKRLNDHAYLSKLKQQLRMEYNAKMDKLEKERAEAEEQRIHRLVVEGKLRHQGEPGSNEQNHVTAVTRKNRTKRSTKNNSRKSSRGNMETVPEVGMKLTCRTNIRAQSAPMTSRAGCVTPQSMVNRLQEADDEADQDTCDLSSEDEDFRKSNNYSKHTQNHILYQMRREKTVDGLYKLAEEFLSTTAKSTVSSP